MAYELAKTSAGFLLLLNFCMYVIVSAIAGWALNRAVDHHLATGPGGSIRAGFSPVYFPIGNEATGFLVIFALIAGVVGAASALSGLHHLRAWTAESLTSNAASALIAWALTLLAMGLASKEIHLHGRSSKLKTLESFVIILSGTQLLYILVIHHVLWVGGSVTSCTVKEATATAKPLRKESPPVTSPV